ncbi:MAG: hypothetical protein LUD78_07395 [Clostridiales bacterium]|nr:hypothetical protein [Clostridiales bacterium]
METRELFDKYFATKNKSTVSKISKQVDKPELYAYEVKIGKKLIDMNANEIYEMLKTFPGRTKGSKISTSSFMQVCSILRGVFDWYIKNIQLIYNPMNDDIFKGLGAMKNFIEDEEPPVTNELVEEFIQRLNAECEEGRAVYCESVVQLFWHGIRDINEIISIREDMLDFENNQIVMSHKTLDVPSRCLEVLKANHEMEIVDAGKGYYVAIPYCGSYFKFLTREKYVPVFDSRKPNELSAQIFRAVRNENAKMGLPIFRMEDCYWLGVYNYLIKRWGEEHAKAMVVDSYHVPKELELLQKTAKEYGADFPTINYLKRRLIVYAR